MLYKEKKLNCDLEFLKACRTNEVAPKFIRFKLFNRNLENTEFYNEWQMHLLDIEIKSKQKQLRNISVKLQNANSVLKTQLSTIDFYFIIEWLKNNATKTIAKVIHTQHKKLINLGIDPNKVIFNYSNYHLSEREKLILSLGLDFALPNYKINENRYALAFEKLFSIFKREPIYNVNNNSLTKLKKELKTMCHKFLKEYNPNKIVSPLFSKADFSILKNLTSRKDIHITRPDKGKGVVLLNKMITNTKYCQSYKTQLNS